MTRIDGVGLRKISREGRRSAHRETPNFTDSRRDDNNNDTDNALISGRLCSWQNIAKRVLRANNYRANVTCCRADYE